MTYDELEPYYDKFEKLCGISGKAGNLRGQKIEGGNIFEGPRQNEYPNPPLKMTASALMFEKAAKELGYHPFPQPSATPAGPTPTARASRSARASIAASATGTAARPMPRRGRMSACCRCCAAIRVQAAHPRLGQPARLRQGGAQGDGRCLHRHPQRRGIRAAGRARRALGLCVRQRLVPAPLRHRRAVRSGNRQGRGRQELLLPALAHGRDDVLREQGVQPVHGRARLAMALDDFNGDNFDHSGLGFFGGSRLPAATATAGRSLPAGSARHPALGLGMEEGDREMVQPRRQHRGVRLATTPTATTISTSIRPTRIARPAAPAHDLQFRATTTTRWRSTAAASPPRSPGR